MLKKSDFTNYDMLISYLEKIGYSVENDLPCFDYAITSPENNMVLGFNEDKFYEITSSEDVINCGTDFRLFVSIAAIREDSDQYQWFTDGIHWEKYPNEGMISDDMIRKWETRYSELGKKNTPHKASVYEILFWFNDYDELFLK